MDRRPRQPRRARRQITTMFGIRFLCCRPSATAGGPVRGGWQAELDGWSPGVPPRKESPCLAGQEAD